MPVSRKCKTCGYFEPVDALPGRGWCRHPKVDPIGVGSRKLEQANELGCKEHRPLWWISKEEWLREHKKSEMLFLLDPQGGDK